MGVTASSDDCFLALRGLRTLAVRLDRHQAKRAARSRSGCATGRRSPRSSIRALPGARGHELWKRDFTGACGLFWRDPEARAKARVDAMLDGLRWFKLGVSWGGFESLILPDPTTRCAARDTGRPGGPYIRLHVGLEDPDDLIDDLAGGSARLRA